MKIPALPCWLLLLLTLGAAARAQNFPGDEALSKLLIEGEDWQVAAEGYGFIDALCADAEGNLYFSDLVKGTGVLKLGLDGKVSEFIKDAPGISGLKFGPDGRLIACQGGLKRVIALEVPSGKISVLATNVQPNDLVVSRKGDIYFTETGRKQVTLIDAKGNVRAVNTGINAPNGITLSADQGMLAVSDYAGTNVWVFRIDVDGGLSAKAPYMTMRSSVNRPQTATGDGMTTDTAGRYYVTTSVGLQMFDGTGRMGGVMSKPQNKALVSVAFAGPKLDWLHVANGDKIYKRRTQAKGALFFLPAGAGR